MHQRPVIPPHDVAACREDAATKLREAHDALKLAEVAFVQADLPDIPVTGAAHNQALRRYVNASIRYRVSQLPHGEAYPGDVVLSRQKGTGHVLQIAEQTLLFALLALEEEAVPRSSEKEDNQW